MIGFWLMGRSEMGSLLLRIAEGIERLSPCVSETDWSSGDAFVWHREGYGVRVDSVNRLPLSLLRGIDETRDILLENTRRFGAGFPANNALLWGARGMGKSSLVKAVHGDVSSEVRASDGERSLLKLVEIHREDIATLPVLMDHVRRVSGYRFIVFCDDLSFESQETDFKALKAALEGGIEGRPSSMVFYATSNRRHLLARDMGENEASTAIHPTDVAQEKISLSDRFGLWLGFHHCDQETYLAMVDGYVAHFGIRVSESVYRPQSLEWSRLRGSRSGRVAWQYIQDLAGREGYHLDV